MPDDVTPADELVLPEEPLASPPPSRDPRRAGPPADRKGPPRGFDVNAAAAEVRAVAEPSAFDPAAGPSDPDHPDAPAWAAWYAEQAQAAARSSDPSAIAWAAWYAERAAACGYDPAAVGAGTTPPPPGAADEALAPASDPFTAPAPGAGSVEPVDFGLVTLPDDEVMEVGGVVVEVEPPVEVAPAQPGILAGAPTVELSAGLSSDAPAEHPAIVPDAPPPDLHAILAAFDVVSAPPAQPAAAPPLTEAAPGAEPAAPAEPDPSLELELTRSWGDPPAPAAEPPLTDPAAFVAGIHRVVVHMADGVVLRGTLGNAALDGGTVDVAAPGGGIERVDTAEIKAIFFMQPPGKPGALPALGDTVRVTFRDGRQVTGTSDDHGAGRVGFFVTPAEARSPTARVWVYRSAVREVVAAAA